MVSLTLFYTVTSHSFEPPTPLVANLSSLELLLEFLICSVFKKFIVWMWLVFLLFLFFMGLVLCMCPFLSITWVTKDYVKAKCRLIPFHTGVCCCFCLFQDSIRRCCCFTGSSIIKSHVMGDRFGSRTSWCLLVKPLDTVRTTVDPQDSNTSGCNCLHGCVSYSCDIRSRLDSTRATTANISFP